MRHSRIFATFSVILMNLAGCGTETAGGPSYYNPATDVNKSLNTFALENQSGLPPVLPHTIFRDLYRGVEPSTEGNDQGFSDQLQARLDRLMGLTPNDEGTDYIRARNPLDLLNEIISSNQIGNFNDGRDLVRRALTNGDAANYNTPVKDALIRLTELNPDKATPASDQNWIYPLLDWKSNPGINKIFRSFQFIASGTANSETNIPELKSAFWSAQYDGDEFRTAGYNRPEYAATDLTSRTLGELELLQEFINQQRDTLTLSKTSGIMIGADEPDCIKVVVNYQSQLVQVFTSKDEPSYKTVNESSTPNPAYCGNQQDGEEELKYTGTKIPERRTQ
ncbi:hypothetical protein ACFQGA_01885 [Marinobacter koreensis]|uniref:Lipoprotein n=1 Tax=Marinobacter koreensis TaxID=335974 RepID=A0ABW0RQM8_9GAMM|nr:hypothetical protein [Marinobacter koreensis]MCK7548657.1 hypothetical protein [Marinobacter koreensis]